MKTVFLLEGDCTKEVFLWFYKHVNEEMAKPVPIIRVPKRCQVTTANVEESQHDVRQKTPDDLSGMSFSGKEE